MGMRLDRETTSIVGIADLLAGLGLELGAGGAVVLADPERAGRCYVHHSTEPVAAVGWAMVSPALSARLLPRSLAQIVAKRPMMDGREALALAAICGADLTMIERRTLTEWGSAVPFSAALDDVLDRHQLLGRFFERGRGDGHYGVRPAGIDAATDEIDQARMRQWRQDYRALPPATQMMVATIAWLYRGGKDDTWLARQPCRWPAAEAVGVMRDAGVLADWARLVALYPGW